MEDTIAAVATALGEGAIGIVKISGMDSLKILNKIFEPKNGTSVDSHRNRSMIYGKILDKETGVYVDQGLTVYMKGPASYTGEDVVEINCHGSMISLRKTLELGLKYGARLAEPGEFTKRAFLNGRLDLSQAEAVIDLIKAKSDVAFDVALTQMQGNFSENIQKIRSDLLDILIKVTVNIDYPDEDIEQLTYRELEKDILAVREKIEELLGTANAGKIISEGLAVSIAGKANVGKSSLLNLLLKESRAIVTDIPGTTRDTIEETISLNGIAVRLTDTAGLRETEDYVEKIGIERSKQSMNQADLILYLVDGHKELEEDDIELMRKLQEKPVIILINKVDLGQNVDEGELRQLLPKAKIIYTSLVTGVGVKDLETAISEWVYSGGIRQNNSFILTNVRHKNLTDQAHVALGDALKMIELKEPLDFIEVDIRSAWDKLGEIIGESVSEDIIEEVFARFCLGK